MVLMYGGIDKDKDPFEIAHEAIEKTRDYFVAMGIPTTLREVGIMDEAKFDVMRKKRLRISRVLTLNSQKRM